MAAKPSKNLKKLLSNGLTMLYALIEESTCGWTDRAELIDFVLGLVFLDGRLSLSTELAGDRSGIYPESRETSL